MSREGVKSGIFRLWPGGARGGGRPGVLRKEDLSDAAMARSLWRSGLFGWAIVVSATYAIFASVLANATRERPLVSPGQVMNETRLVRVDFEIPDERATADARQVARDRAPWVFVAEQAVLERIETELRNLPVALAGVERFADVEESILREFGLNAEAFAQVRGEVEEGGGASEAWRKRVDALMEVLRGRPLVEGPSWQSAMVEGKSEQIEARVGDEARLVAKTAMISLADDLQVQESMASLARRAGFSGASLGVVVSRLAGRPLATFRLDASQTSARQVEAAEAVETITRPIRSGDVIYAREGVLTESQRDLLVAEIDHFSRAERGRTWIRRLSVSCAVGAVVLAIAGYVRLFGERIARRPGRMWGLAGLLAGCLTVACAGTVAWPSLLMLTGVAPTVLAAVILVVAYDRRIALALGVLHGLLVCVALNQPVGTLAVMVTGVGTAVWHLGEIRDRRTIVRMSAWTGVSLAAGTVLVSLVDRPIIRESIVQALVEAGLAGFGGLLAGGVTLFILPTIERVFGITTGMTLFELRDPKQALLRELQQRAPGTYNHSLTVASIAEAAADAIGANGLLAYVGSLYHDIGKMNKPEYFVENVSGGPSRHDKLSPAMSLLVIVGHVKDGMEMAREFGLPSSIRHFIEAHHGTTLVEFFYDRARRQAEDQPEASKPPDEIEYRYPGPKPRTKEAAILMLSDAVESATRGMQEPTPSRIDALVREFATKRLLDGQFDDCDLTLRDLALITESISKSVTAIFHGRIAYPSASKTRARRA